MSWVITGVNIWPVCSHAAVLVIENIEFVLVVQIIYAGW